MVFRTLLNSLFNDTFNFNTTELEILDETEMGNTNTTTTSITKQNYISTTINSIIQEIYTTTTTISPSTTTTTLTKSENATTTLSTLYTIEPSSQVTTKTFIPTALEPYVTTLGENLSFIISSTTPAPWLNITKHGYNNITESTMNWPAWEIWTVVPFLTLIMIFIVLGNLLVVVAVLTQKSLRTPSNIYILSLAVADLLVGIFILSFNVIEMIQGWELGPVLCRIWLTADVTLCSTSILHISAIAVDRFRSINEGLPYAQSRTIKSSLIVCASLWFLALWISSPPVLGWNDWEHMQSQECYLTHEAGYIIHSASGAFFIPAFVMVGLYFRIYFMLRKKFRERSEMKCLEPCSSHDYLDQSSADGGNNSSGEIIEENKAAKSSASIFNPTLKSKSKSKNKTLRKQSDQISAILKKKIKYSLTKERKAAKTLGVLIGAFLVCWTPFTLTYLYSGFGIVNDVLFRFVTWLGYVNSGINPVVYTVYSLEFKKAFKKILRLERY